MLIAAAWLGLLMWDNVRRRSGEIGILRAIGVGGSKIFILVQTRALIVGVLGSVIGIGAGFGISVYQATKQGDPAPQLQWTLAVVCVGAATFLVLLSGWPSAWLATWTDPAVVLREGDV
jgi:ABC-type antimicrobial peptide transport system permease subunit